MTSKPWVVVVIGLAVAAAVAGAWSLQAIYRDGNPLWWGAALLAPAAALCGLYRDFGKRVVAILFATLVVSAATGVWLKLSDGVSGLALSGMVLVAILVPIAVDLSLLDTGTRLAIGRRLGTAALAVFAVTFLPLATSFMRSQHHEVLVQDWQLIQEMSWYASVSDNTIVFNHVDPRHKQDLKNRLAVRTAGQTYPLSNAHFESVSSERTVQKKREKRGRSETTVVERERTEEMRVVVDLDGRPSSTFVVESTRGPVTICEQEIWPSVEEDPQGPVS
ncbi:MAG: hypothetical protein SF182_26825 [Deltaproteobacteria bacterium]|nr:hypothetical protein [Deltaproteobacteria bacterium]